LIAIVATACTLPALAEKVTVNNIEYESIDFAAKTAKLTNGKAATGTFYIPKEVVIPEMYVDADGHNQTRNVTCKVVEIGQSAFSGNDKITMIKGGENVVSIKRLAFNKCPNLTSVALWEGLEFIGEQAFNGCVKLTETLKIPASVSKMEKEAFRNTGIKELSFEVNNGKTKLTEIPMHAFSYCPNLNSLKLANGTNIIGERAFEMCEMLGKGGLIEIPGSVTKIDKGAFACCSSLWGVTLHDGLGTICNNAFTLTALKEIEFPSTLTIIEGVLDGTDSRGAFNGCHQLAKVTFNEGLTEIGHGAFRGCDILTRVDLPYSLDYSTGIGEAAFMDCSKLKIASVGADQSLMVPRSAFENCAPSNLTEKGFEGILKRVNNELDDKNTLQIEVEENAEQHVIRKSSGKGRGWIIGPRAFYGCRDMIYMPDNIESFGERAFYGCEALTSFPFPAGMTEVPAYAFYNMPITSMHLPSGVRRIGEGAFKICDKLAEINIPDGVTAMADEVFYGCKKLTTIDLPVGLRSIGKRSFYNSGLTAIELPSALEMIGENAFVGCPITAVIIPDLVKSVGLKAFNGCRLNDIVLGSPTLLDAPLSEPLSIGAGAFYAKYYYDENPAVTSYHVVPPVLETDEAVTDPHFNSYVYEHAVLTVPAGTAAAYREAEGWKLFKNIVEMGSSGVTAPEADAAVEIAVGADGSIAVSGVAEDVPVVVYGIDGSVAYRGTGAVTVDALPSGFYVVSVGSVSRKVRI